MYEAQVDCNIAGVFINHFIYANDICLLCSSASALQGLLNVCNEYALSHDVIFNYKNFLYAMYLEKFFFLFRVSN